MNSVAHSTTSPRDKNNHIAIRIKDLIASKHMMAAREEFQELIANHQTRASRIAYYYLREPVEVEEAVQDAFVKSFIHLPSFRDEFYFDNWFTSILVNGCLDRLKAKKRRTKWILPAGEETERLSNSLPTTEATPEASLLKKERRAQLMAEIDRLPNRQRDVMVLHQLEGHSTTEVADMLSISNATVRVHLFRALKSLKTALSTERWLFENPGTDWTKNKFREGL
jgi:RNA polymerase sigma-70 factor (ECF subfamily)